MCSNCEFLRYNVFDDGSFMECLRDRTLLLFCENFKLSEIVQFSSVSCLGPFPKVSYRRPIVDFGACMTYSLNEAVKKSKIPIYFDCKAAIVF